MKLLVHGTELSLVQALGLLQLDEGLVESRALGDAEPEGDYCRL